ncbi:MAG: hypothetical protein R3E48_09320, partial [Burkholderiaceae bacterium]
MFLSQTGLLHHDRGRATPGYTLIASVMSRTARLIDNDAREVHEWHLPASIATYTRLLPGGQSPDRATCSRR